MNGKHLNTIILLLASCFLLQFAAAAADDEAMAKQYANEPPSPEALIKLGETLEKMSDPINTRAERECFRSPSKIKGTPCVNAFVEKLNATYGTGSFEYLEQMVFIRYTGAHYKRAIAEFPNSPLASQVAYLYLIKNLIGHPEHVLPQIRDYTARYKDGEWGRKGRLLWARINEDIWWIHRKWSWVLYNWKLSDEELIVKAEPYRQEALRTFLELAEKDGRAEEGLAARGEYELLKAYKDDGKLYGIVNESDVKGTLALPGHE